MRARTVRIRLNGSHYRPNAGSGSNSSTGTSSATPLYVDVLQYLEPPSPAPTHDFAVAVRQQVDPATTFGVGDDSVPGPGCVVKSPAERCFHFYYYTFDAFHYELILFEGRRFRKKRRSYALVTPVAAYSNSRQVAAFQGPSGARIPFTYKHVRDLHELFETNRLPLLYDHVRIPNPKLLRLFRFLQAEHWNALATTTAPTSTTAAAAPVACLDNDTVETSRVASLAIACGVATPAAPATVSRWKTACERHLSEQLSLKIASLRKISFQTNLIWDLAAHQTAVKMQKFKPLINKNTVRLDIIPRETDLYATLQNFARTFDLRLQFQSV